MKPTPDSSMKYQDFLKRYPTLGEAWDLIHEAEGEGPLDAGTIRLVKLAVAIGAHRKGAVQSAVRKALLAGISLEEMEQVVALATSTVGMPSAVAVFTWIQEVLAETRDAGSLPACLARRPDQRQDQG